MIYIHIFLNGDYVFTLRIGNLRYVVETDFLFLVSDIGFDHDKISVGFILNTLNCGYVGFILSLKLDHMIPSAEVKFLFLVAMTLDLDLQKSIGFFLSLWAGHISIFELIQ